MRKLIIFLCTIGLCVPAFALADSGSPSAQQQCATERTAMGADAFKALYGTNGNKSNAFGKCVSKRASANEKSQSNAAAQCRAERSADPDAFKTKYGTGKNGANAFGKCVSGKAKAAETAEVKATDNAAKACWSERQADAAAFKAKYGTGPNKSNAFGKCVSGKVKHSK
jgi:hypothetical protein